MLILIQLVEQNILHRCWKQNVEKIYRLANYIFARYPYFTLLNNVHSVHGKIRSKLPVSTNATFICQTHVNDFWAHFNIATHKNHNNRQTWLLQRTTLQSRKNPTQVLWSAQSFFGIYLNLFHNVHQTLKISTVIGSKYLKKHTIKKHIWKVSFLATTGMVKANPVPRQYVLLMFLKIHNCL